eukprot:COSAG02_NODE_40485_length_405_cov_0.624183_1_plen_38_part_01
MLIPIHALTDQVSRRLERDSRCIAHLAELGHVLLVLLL